MARRWPAFEYPGRYGGNVINRRRQNRLAKRSTARRELARATARYNLHAVRRAADACPFLAISTQYRRWSSDASRQPATVNHASHFRARQTTTTTQLQHERLIELLHEELRVRRRVRRRLLLKPLRLLLHALFYLEDFCRLVVVLNSHTHIK